MNIRSTLSSLREYLTPVSHVSSFRKTGQITPEEFVTAGDYLVAKFPTWAWASAPPGKRWDFLPADKQVLVTRHVPSHMRAAAYTDVEDGAVDEDGWVSTGAHNKTGTGSGQPAKDARSDGPGASEEVVDIDLGGLSDEDDNDGGDPAAYSYGSTKAASRTYNLYIAYSTSYRVPKLYLSGFNVEGSPLKPAEMFEDIMGDYRDKTVTIERAPFENDLTVVSIHPCRHAQVMKILMDRAEQRLADADDDKDVSAAPTSAANADKDLAQGIAKVGLADADTDADADWEDINRAETDYAIRVDQYLVLFLKFIASVTPGIEHDFTMSA